MEEPEPSTNPCPFCGLSNEMAIPTGPEASPKPGDGMMCGYCLEMAILGTDQRSRRPTAVELLRMMKAPGWADVVKARRSIHDARRQAVSDNPGEDG